MRVSRLTQYGLLAACLGCWVWPAWAAVRFDGLMWYHSEDPNRLIVNEDCQLVWLNPKAPDQVTVRLSCSFTFLSMVLPSRLGTSSHLRCK